MNETQIKLQKFAHEKALPYLSELPKFKEYIDRLSFVLVGSSATGLCRPDSDVDIVIMCENEVYDVISEGTRWVNGRGPAEVIIDGIQLHYYATTFDLINQKFNELDDTYLYTFSNCVILKDVNDSYKDKIESKNSKVPEIRRQRIEGKLDMLMRRSRVLEYCINANEDIVITTQTYFEVIKLAIKVASLLDNIDFEPRKRLVSTGLSGKIGALIKDNIKQLFYIMGLTGMKDGHVQYPRELTETIDILTKEALIQGFNAGLHVPDRRHIERL